ncbi:antA/AntB antirepressor family protein, partial [Klebsiella pneumoniae]|nr:antA/AntB antirepressor family protein [Klebsiella pneumoniae]
DGVDYITAQGLSSPKSGSTKARPQKTIEYLISLDAAKQICVMGWTMRVFTEKGRNPKGGRPTVDYCSFHENVKQTKHGGHNRLDYEV